MQRTDLRPDHATLEAARREGIRTTIEFMAARSTRLRRIATASRLTDAQFHDRAAFSRAATAIRLAADDARRQLLEDTSTSLD